MSESDLQTQIDALREQVNRVMQAFSAMDIPEELSNVEDAVGESEGVDSSALDEIQQRVGLVESLARRRDPKDPKLLSARGAGTPFTVLVTQDGGNDGDPDTTTECAWTYEVRDLDDTTVLATDVTPETPRMHYAHYWYAGETRTGATGDTTSRYGLACYDSDGDLHLLVAYGEILEETVCAT